MMREKIKKMDSVNNAKCKCVARWLWETGGAIAAHFVLLIRRARVSFDNI